SPPFTADANPEAIYDVDRRDGSIAKQSAAHEAAPTQASAASASAHAAAGSKNLGELARPGKALGNTTQRLHPGDTVTFRTRENQIFGVGEIRVEPRGALEVHRKMLESAPPHRLGGTSLYEYTFSVPADAKAGATAKITTGGHFQTRN